MFLASYNYQNLTQDASFPLNPWFLSHLIFSCLVVSLLKQKEAGEWNANESHGNSDASQVAALSSTEELAILKCRVSSGAEVTHRYNDIFISCSHHMKRKVF